MGCRILDHRQSIPLQVLGNALRSRCTPLLSRSSATVSCASSFTGENIATLATPTARSQHTLLSFRALLFSPFHLPALRSSRSLDGIPRL